LFDRDRRRLQQSGLHVREIIDLIRKAPASGRSRLPRIASENLESTRIADLEEVEAHPDPGEGEIVRL